MNDEEAASVVTGGTKHAKEQHVLRSLECT